MELRGLGDRWLAGELVPGVTFAHHDRVSIAAGRHDGEHGLVQLLLAVSPEPVYLVEVASGAGGARGVRVRQSALRPLT